MDRCNLRCTYCMPESVFHPGYAFLRREELLRYEELVFLAQAFVDLGVQKIRITGGEPLLRRDLTRFVAMLRDLSPTLDLALTTNGILLPQCAKGLRDAGLNRLTLSFDSLRDDRLRAISGRNLEVKTLWKAIDSAQEAGFDSLKINVMVQRGVNHDEVIPFANAFAGTPHRLRFIEFMDVGATNNWEPERVFTAREMREQLESLGSLEPLPTGPTAVAREWNLNRKDGSNQVIGFISSVSEPFCGGCSRARISAIGEMFTCLFASEGISLRERIREGIDPKDLRTLLADIWNPRMNRYSEERPSFVTPSRKRVEMSYIGG